jgi:subtilisin family serine protease
MEQTTKLRFGKSHWLQLKQVKITSTIDHGVRVFEPTGETSGRAAVFANRVVATTFEKAVPSFATMAERKEIGADKVEAAVFRDERDILRVVYREAVVRFEPKVSQAKRKMLLAKYGLKVRDANRFHPDQFVVYDPKRRYVAGKMIELANDLTETDEVAFAFPNFVSEFKRDAVPQPITAQWHLAIVRARQAWGATLGKGITAAVLDDGVDVGHPNLKDNIRRKPDPSEPKDLFGRDFFVGEDAPDHFDPRPKRFQSPFDQMTGNDIHGTPCAGVIAASGKVSGVLGVAPEARILAVKVFHADDLATESRVANAIRYASRFADILSCSWSGPASPDIESALEEAGGGRGGKGCPVFCATGNDFAKSVSFPARSRFAIGVGASTDKERRAEYSNRGTEVSVVAPSSGGTKSVFTTDVGTPGRGFNIGTAAAGGADGLHTDSFGGTSSATPLVAGIAALILAANPKLTRDEVRDILQQTAVKIGPKNSYNAKGHSKEFGFGRVNAEAAVARAVQLGVAKQAIAAAAKPPAARRKKAAGARRKGASKVTRRKSSRRKRAA